MQKVLFETQAVTEHGAYDANDAKLGDLEGVGTLRWVDDRCYRWCQNRHSANMSAGDVVFHTFSDLANAHKYVRDGNNTDLGFMAGVVASTAIAFHSTATKGNYGWVQVLGYNGAVASLPDGTTAIVAGHVGIGSNGTRTVTWGTIMTSAPLYTRNIMFLEALASMETPAATTSKCWISCL